MISRLSFALAGILLFSLPLAGCAKTGEGSYHTSVLTILAGLKTGKFIINEDDTGPAPKTIDLRPEGGQIMLSGLLDSDGMYGYNGVESPSMAELVGLDWNKGNCKFAAIIDKDTGEILKAQIVLNTGDGRAGSYDANLTDKLNGSYGTIGKNSFTFSVRGPVWHDETAGISEDYEPLKEPTGSEGAVVTGKGNLLAAKNGDTFKVKLYFGVDSIPSRPPPKTGVTFGRGVLTVTR